MYFGYFVIISPWKSAGPVIGTNLNALYPRMLCAKSGWNWSSGSGEGDFLKFRQCIYFCFFCNYLPLEKGRAFYLNKHESPSSKNALCQVWLKLALWSLRRRFFFNFLNVFSLSGNLFFLKKGRALYLNILESPSPKDALCQVCLKLAQWFWIRRWKCEKFTTMTITTKTDNF